MAGNKMNKQFTLDEFNEILISALKDQEPATLLGLYQAELNTAMYAKIEAMENMVKMMNDGKPYHKQLRMINNIDSNCDHIKEKMDELIAQHPELAPAEDEEEEDT